MLASILCGDSRRPVWPRYLWKTGSWSCRWRASLRGLGLHHKSVDQAILPPLAESSVGVEGVSSHCGYGQWPRGQRAQVGREHLTSIASRTVVLRDWAAGTAARALKAEWHVVVLFRAA